MVHPTQHHFVEGDYPEASAQDVSKLQPVENGGNTGMYCGSCFYTSYIHSYPVLSTLWLLRERVLDMSILLLPILLRNLSWGVLKVITLQVGQTLYCLSQSKIVATLLCEAFCVHVP